MSQGSGLARPILTTYFGSRCTNVLGNCRVPYDTASVAVQSLSYIQLFCNSFNSPPGSSAHGILQARILEWVAISSCRGSAQPRDQTCISCVSCISGRSFYPLNHTESPYWAVKYFRYSHYMFFIPYMYYQYFHSVFGLTFVISVFWRLNIFNLDEFNLSFFFFLSFLCPI